MRFHDAEVVKIEINRQDSSACISLIEEVGGASIVVHLHNLKVIRCEDYMIQNVVSQVLRASLGHFSFAAITHWVKWVTSVSDADSWFGSKHRDEWAKKCFSNELELIVFEPSAGVQIVAICESILIHTFANS